MANLFSDSFLENSEFPHTICRCEKKKQQQVRRMEKKEKNVPKGRLSLAALISFAYSRRASLYLNRKPFGFFLFFSSSFLSF